MIFCKFKKTGKLDVKYLKKSKVGEPCESSVEYTTQLCEEGMCFQSQQKSKLKLKLML